MSRLFVDLDGVLADFDAGAMAALGMSCRDFEQLHGVPLMWRWLEQTPDFYARLSWTGDGRDLWWGIKLEWRGPRPIILSGLPLGDWAQPQKRAWCAEHLGRGVPVILCMSADKARYCEPGDILIDDREHAGIAWHEAGGKFIHHRSAVESVAALRALFSPQAAAEK